MSTFDDSFISSSVHSYQVRLEFKIRVRQIDGLKHQYNFQLAWNSENEADAKRRHGVINCMERVNDIKPPLNEAYVTWQLDGSMHDLNIEKDISFHAVLNITYEEGKKDSISKNVFTLNVAYTDGRNNITLCDPVLINLHELVTKEDKFISNGGVDLNKQLVNSIENNAHIKLVVEWHELLITETPASNNVEKLKSIIQELVQQMLELHTAREEEQLILPESPSSPRTQNRDLVQLKQQVALYEDQIKFKDLQIATLVEKQRQYEGYAKHLESLVKDMGIELQNMQSIVFYDENRELRLRLVQFKEEMKRNRSQTTEKEHELITMLQRRTLIIIDFFISNMDETKDEYEVGDEAQTPSISANLQLLIDAIEAVMLDGFSGPTRIFFFAERAHMWNFIEEVRDVMKGMENIFFINQLVQHMNKTRILETDELRCYYAITSILLITQNSPEYRDDNAYKFKNWIQMALKFVQLLSN